MKACRKLGLLRGIRAKREARGKPSKSSTMSWNDSVTLCSDSGTSTYLYLILASSCGLSEPSEGDVQHWLSDAVNGATKERCNGQTMHSCYSSIETNDKSGATQVEYEMSVCDWLVSLGPCSPDKDGATSPKVTGRSGDWLRARVPVPASCHTGS